MRFMTWSDDYDPRSSYLPDAVGEGTDVDAECYGLI